MIKMKSLLLSGLLRKLYGYGDVIVIRERAVYSVNHLQGVQLIMDLVVKFFEFLKLNFLVCRP